MFCLKELDGRTVRHDVTLETPAAPENVREEIRAARDWNTVIIVIRTHRPERARILERSLERWKIDHFHFARRNLRVCASCAIAPAFRNAVYGEVLRSGNYVLGLNRAHLMPSKLCRKVRIFTVRFNRPSPAGIARQIQYRRVDIRVAENARFLSRDVADIIHKGSIPRA